MTILDLSSLHRGGGAGQPADATQQRALTARGIIARPPTSETDSMHVVIKGMSLDDGYEVVAGNWQPRGNALPAKDDECLIVFDDEGDACVPVWSGVGALTEQTYQPGDLIESFASSRPGSLLCDGTTYPAADYPALALACPELVSGANLTVPDMRGCGTIGAGTGPGRTPRTLGATVGEESHLLVVGEMPSHNHGGATGTGSTGTGTTGSTSINHHHEPLGGLFLIENNGVTNFGIPLQSGGTAAGQSTTADKDVIHSHSVPSLSVPALAISSQGGGGAHNNMQPSVVVNYFIKT